MLIKKAVDKEKIIILLNPIFISWNKSSKTFREKYVVISQNDKNGISLGLN